MMRLIALVLWTSLLGAQIVTDPGGGGGGGGSTSPGGSDTQIQFNSSGTFGGVSGFTWNGSILTLPGKFGGVAIDDDDCTGDQGRGWWDSTDQQWEFCNANSGAPLTFGGGGGGAPTDATYWVSSADGTLSAEVVIDSLSALETALSYDFSDAANLTGSAPTAVIQTNWAAAGGAVVTANRVLRSTGSTIEGISDFLLGASSNKYIGGSTTGAFRAWYGGAGSASAPTYYFTGDEDTGIYRIGADQIGISTGGTLRLQIDSNGLGIGTGGLAFSSLPSATDGTITYCTDCTITSGSDNTCTGSGSGALAVRLNSTWRCMAEVGP